MYRLPACLLSAVCGGAEYASSSSTAVGDKGITFDVRISSSKPIFVASALCLSNIVVIRCSWHNALAYMHELVWHGSHLASALSLYPR